ncbi:cobalamin-binding protein [Gammaproteobacteria bacterium]|mgnify:FL=1|nr:cobalamin-binding protein [Gammaproteobacteria bacterium]
MKSKILIAWIVDLLLISFSGAAEIIDDEGNLVRLEKPAERIISLAPSLTELVYAAGAGSRLIGVVEYSDYPASADSLPVVGRFDGLDIERILELKPDLIVAWQSGNPKSSITQLKNLNLKVYVAEPKNLSSIASHIEKLSVLTGTESRAQIAIQEFDSIYGELKRRYNNKSKVKIFYQLWDRPIITVGGNELINDIIELCGGENIFGDLPQLAPKIDQESVLIRNPKVIVASGSNTERPQWLDEWKLWPQLTAVAEENLYFIIPELLQRHTPRALLGTRQMCEYIDQARKAI